MEALSGICTVVFGCLVIIWLAPIFIKLLEGFKKMQLPVYPTHRRSPYWDVLASQMEREQQPEPEPEKKSIFSGRNLATGLSIGVSLLRLWTGTHGHNHHHQHH